MDNPENVVKKKSMPVWARIVLVLIAFLIVSGIFTLIGAVVAQIPLSEMATMSDMSSGQKLIIQFFSFLGLMVVMLIFMKYVDKEPFLSVGLPFKGRIADIGSGFIAALVLLGGGTLILKTLGFLEVEAVSFNASDLVINFVLFIFVALGEEIFARGYILRNLMSATNKFLALGISAMIFSLMHGLNANFSIVPFINILLAGILLGASYIYTKNLWFPISLHLFWNFFQGPVFGYAVSGNETESILSINTSGNATIHGGDFGFEGSIICTILLAVLSAIIFYHYNKKTSVKA